MKKLPVITQPCYTSNFKPIGVIQGDGKTFDDVINSLRNNALVGTTHVFNAKIESVHTANRWTATADCFKQLTKFNESEDE